MRYYRVGTIILITLYRVILINVVLRVANWIIKLFTHSTLIYLGVYFAVWSLFMVYLIRGSLWPLRSRPKEVQSTMPLKAWKAATIVPVRLMRSRFDEPAHVQLPQYWFEPLIASTHYYGVESAAECYRGNRATLPHEGHACGFYAYIRRWSVRNQLFHSDCAVLEVELYGDVIEGARHILRGQYQRVLSVSYFDLCEQCRGPLPRVAAGLILNTKQHIVPVCNRHALARRGRLMSLQEVAAGLGTEVRFRSTWLSRLARWLHRG